MPDPPMYSLPQNPVISTMSSPYVPYTMEPRKLTMSHTLWAQRTPRMAYHVQGRVVFHAAWKRGWSPVGLKYSGGVLHPPILPRKIRIRPDYFYQNSGPVGSAGWLAYQYILGPICIQKMIIDWINIGFHWDPENGHFEKCRYGRIYCAPRIICQNAGSSGMLAHQRILGLENIAGLFFSCGILAHQWILGPENNNCWFILLVWNAGSPADIGSGKSLLPVYFARLECWLTSGIGSGIESGNNHCGFFFSSGMLAQQHILGSICIWKIILQVHFVNFNAHMLSSSKSNRYIAQLW